PPLGRRMPVRWSTTPRRLDVALPALGTSAQAMDRFGTRRPLSVDADGHIRVTLAPATANTVLGFPDAYFIGGEPLIVLEPLPDAYRPLEPTWTNLPGPGEP